MKHHKIFLERYTKPEEYHLKKHLKLTENAFSSLLLFVFLDLKALYYFRSHKKSYSYKDFYLNTNCKNQRKIKHNWNINKNPTISFVMSFSKKKWKTLQVITIRKKKSLNKQKIESTLKNGESKSPHSKLKQPQSDKPIFFFSLEWRTERLLINTIHQHGRVRYLISILH